MVERVFDISEKSRNEWLSENQRNVNTLRVAVANDIIQNARELDPTGVSWDEVIERYTCRQGNGDRMLKGRGAVASVIAEPLAAMSIRLGWHMHSPGTVYVSGVHFAKFLTVEAAMRRARASSMEIGEIKFDSPQRGVKAIHEAEALRDRILAYKGSLDESLIQYARLFLLQDERYLEILGTDLHKTVKTNAKRYELFGLLRGGDTGKAYDIFLSHQPKDPSRVSYMPFAV